MVPLFFLIKNGVPASGDIIKWSAYLMVGCLSLIKNGVPARGHIIKWNVAKTVASSSSQSPLKKL